MTGRFAVLLLAVSLGAQQPRATVTRVDYVHERLAVEIDGVPWASVELAYPRLPWSADRAGPWSEAGTEFPLGTAADPFTIRTTAFLDFGTPSESYGGIDVSDGRLAVHVEVRDAADPPDDPPFWLSLVPVPGAVDPDGGGEPEPAWAGSQVPIHVAPLDPPAAVLTARLTLATEPFVTNGDGDRVAVARLEIDVGPRRLSSPLALELPEPLPSRSGTRVPTEVRAAIENAEELELLAMGGADTERTFHGHAVAGAVPSADPVLRRRIAWVLQKAALLGPTWSVECFEPQLGIRIRDPRLGTFDLLVSASCSKLLVHQPGQEVVPVRLDEAVTWGLFAEIAAATGLALPRDG